MSGDCRHDRPGIALDRRHLPGVMRRKPSADIDHPQIDIGLGEQRKHSRGVPDGAVPLPEIGLLRADMKRHAIWVKTEFSRSAQQPDCHLGSANALARQRPLSPRAVD